MNDEVDVLCNFPVNLFNLVLSFETPTTHTSGATTFLKVKMICDYVDILMIHMPFSHVIKA